MHFFLLHLPTPLQNNPLFSYRRNPLTFPTHNRNRLVCFLYYICIKKKNHHVHWCETRPWNTNLSWNLVVGCLATRYCSCVHIIFISFPQYHLLRLFVFYMFANKYLDAFRCASISTCYPGQSDIPFSVFKTF